MTVDFLIMERICYIGMRGKNQPEMRLQGLLEFSPLSNGSTGALENQSLNAILW